MDTKTVRVLLWNSMDSKDKYLTCFDKSARYQYRMQFLLVQVNEITRDKTRIYSILHDAPGA